MNNCNPFFISTNQTFTLIVTAILSQKQQERLLQESRSAKTTGFIVGFIFFGVAACLLFFIAAVFPQMELLLEKIIWLSFFGNIYLAKHGPWAVFSKIIKKTNLTIKRVNGIVNLVAVQSLSGMNDFKKVIVHELHVGAQTFQVTSLLANYVQQGDSYAIYFVRDTIDSKLKLQMENIMSMELLEAK